MLIYILALARVKSMRTAIYIYIYMMLASTGVLLASAQLVYLNNR
jgi:hypothetical protein